MTKAELLKRYRWLWAVVPLLSFTSLNLFLLAFQKWGWMRIPHPGVFQFLVDITFTLAPVGWVGLTLTCSAFTAFLRVEEAKLEGVLRIPVLVLVALMIAALHLIACVVLFAVLSPRIP